MIKVTLREAHSGKQFLCFICKGRRMLQGVQTVTSKCSERNQPYHMQKLCYGIEAAW